MPPPLLSLAYDPMVTGGGLLEYASEPEDEETQKPKGRQGIVAQKVKAQIFLL
jgi:hypothetical protein